MDCCSLNINLSKSECSENWVNEPLAERVRKLKSNPYTTKEVWEAKNILNVETGEYFSYADIDKLINN